jgi:hypothetical protein
MAIWSRLRGLVGGHGGIRDKTLASATTLTIPDDLTWVNLTGTATVTSLLISSFTYGRMVWLYQSDSGTTTLTNSPGTTTAGQMDLGGLDPSNAVLGPTDVIQLYCRSDGTWIRVSPVTNN